MKFYENLKELRVERAFSQYYMAKQLGIHQQSYSDYELGISEPNIAKIVKIADIFEVSTDFLLGRTADPNALVWQSETKQNSAL